MDNDLLYVPGPIMYSSQDIAAAVERVAAQIRQAIDNPSLVTLVVLLDGARPFGADLASRLPQGVQVVYVRVSSYGLAVVSSGVVSIERLEPGLFTGRHLIIVDDIYDTGRTLTALKTRLETQNPLSIRTCVMFVKKCARQEAVKIDWWGLEVENVFVVGYGLDYNGTLRELEYLAELIPATQQKEQQ